MATGVLSCVVKWVNTLCFMCGVYCFLVRNRGRIDVLHTHVASWNAGFAQWLGHRFGIPVVCKASYLPAFDEFIGSVPFGRTWDRWRQRCTYIALNEAMTEDLVGQGVAPERIHVIPNGVVIPAAQTDVVAHRRVLYVGNFTQGNKHKGFDVLIAAWSLVYREQSDARLVIAGGGNPLPWIEMATDRGCVESIEFLGHVNDLGTMYLTSGLFVLPSRGEGISNALLEAQSYGVPAVVTDIPGNRSVVEDGKNGLVVPLESVSAFAEAIAMCLRNPELRSLMGERAREMAKQRFAVDRIIELQLALYRVMTCGKDGSGHGHACPARSRA